MRNIRPRLLPLLLLTLVGLTAVPALSAKPNPKNKATKGTTQASGQNAKVGTTYTLGKVMPINITLDKVEYTIEPILFGDAAIWPGTKEKLLVIHYTLHNPMPRDWGLSWNSVGFEAVDANDKNWRYVQDTAIEGTHAKGYFSLKRAQKTHLYTAIIVPGEGEIPKLIVSSIDKLVLRYDLRGQVKPLPKEIASPADPSGATAPETIPAQLGVYYPLRGLHVKIDSVAYATTSIKGRTPPKGGRYLIISATAKNLLSRPFSFVWSSVTPKVEDMDGGELKWTGDPLFASRDESAKASIEQNKEFRFRHIFEVPAGAQAKTYTFYQSGGHFYALDISQVQ
jgi:hypothetical protein